MIQKKFVFFVIFLSDLAFAGGGEGAINFYESVGRVFGISDAHTLHSIAAILGSVFAFALVTLVGVLFKQSVEMREDPSPDGKVSVSTFVESIMDIVHSIAKDNCGTHYRNYLPLLGALFVFILFANLTGLIPGFPPPTENIGINLAMGIAVFFVYNAAGFKEHGFGYLKQFMGPMIVLAPLFIIIELISHSARPFSLSLRLMGNIFADHLMLGEFTKLTFVVVPSVLMFFGLLVAVVQSFIFTLLTGIYISMATSHDH